METLDMQEILFRESYLYTREDIIKSVELYIEHEKLNEESRYPAEILKNRIKLCEKFLSAVKKSKLPVITDPWWFYEYQFLGDRMELNLSQIDDIKIDNNEIDSMSVNVEHTLLCIESDFLTVEKFASAHGVKPVTVRQWIRRGKLRHAKKVGRDWLIPSIEEKPRRGFLPVQYLLEDESTIKSDEFPMLKTANEITILQDQIEKTKFTCYLTNQKAKFHSILELSRSEVERLEHTIIESGKARVAGNIQFVPDIRT